MKIKPAHKPHNQPLRYAIYARTATLKDPSEENSISQQVGGFVFSARLRSMSV